MGYDWDFTYLYPFVDAFIKGTWITLKISIISFVLGTSIGIIWGVILHYTRKLHILLLANDMVRAVPMLVLLFLVYYFPLKAVLGLRPFSSETSAIIAFTISQAVYTGDLVNSAINNVSEKLKEAGQAIGLSNIHILRYVIIPDVFRQIIPAEIAFFIGLVRLSSLASVIGVQDVVFVASIASGQNFRSIEGWVVVGFIYILIVIPITYFLRKIEGASFLKRRF